MQKQFYDRISAPFRNDQKKIKVLKAANTGITAFVSALYVFILLYLLFTGDSRLVRAVVVPAVSFAAVTVFRGICDSPRPYEVWDEPPLIKRDKKGHSFPSRHIFSIFMIAMTAGYIFPAAGWIAALLGAALACIRVIARIHFVRDVAAGAAIALVCAAVGYYLI